jgi:hypothetical protein
MLIVVVALLIVSIAALAAAVIIGTPAPAHPKHGTFGIDGLDGSFIAWACVGLCAIGLVLLLIDARLERRRPAQTEEPAETDHTAGDELFGEPEVERDLAREN